MGVMQWLVIAFMAATAIVMVMGIVTMMRNKNTSSGNSNKLMQWRVILQAIALAILAAIFYYAR